MISFPIEFFNTKSQTGFQFHNKDQLLQRLTEEINTFRGFQRFGQLPEIQKNVSLINDIIKSINHDNLDEQDIERLSENYTPYKDFLENFLNDNDPVEFRALFCISVIGDKIGVNPGTINGVVALNASVAGRLFRTNYLSPKLRDDLETTMASINQKLFEIEERSHQHERDWQNLKNDIEGFKADALLQAPKKFWETRGTEQSNQTKKLRGVWQISLTTTFLFSVAYFYFYNSTIFGASTSLPPLIGRLFVYGTLTSFLVWWSRQTLKELRNAQHLAEDAKERVTMIETFALLKSADLGGDGYQIILNALFRPAGSNSIDDDSPRLPFEAIAKVVESRLRGS